MSYPAPRRPSWIVGVEFLDGTFIGDLSDEAVIDRWHRVSWSFDGSRADFKDMIVRRCRTLFGATLVGIGALTPDRQFLDALWAEGCVTVIRKD